MAGDYELGAWMGARAVAAHNAAMAEDAMATLAQANANIRFLNDHVAKQEAENAELRARIAQMATQLAVAEADVAGTRAVVGAFKQAHPNSPLLAETGQISKNGKPKTTGTLVYQNAFDTKAHELGIRNPKQHRAD